MNSIPFFAPVLYEVNIPTTLVEKAAEWVDSYFYFGGRQARVITTDDVTRTHLVNPRGRPPLLCSALKVLSYVTIVLPLLGLALKAILRKCIDLPERVKGISPYAVNTLPIDLSRKFDFTAAYSNRVLEALDDIDKQSLQKNMRAVVQDIIDEINTRVGSDETFSQGGDEWIVLPLKKEPIFNKKSSQDYGFTQLYRDRTMSMGTVASEQDPFILDVVLNALENQGYILNLGRQKDGRWQRITVL